MDISKTLFATMVKNARMDRHWTQEELAEKLGVSPTYLGDLERHKGTLQACHCSVKPCGY